MPRYHMGVREIHVVTVEVEAANKEEALEKAGRRLEKGVDEIDREYSDTLDPDTWTVEEVE